jgi:UDPglucose 6-dehydrogenase
LVKTARDANSPIRIVETVVSINEARKTAMADKVIEACGGSVDGKNIALLGLTFKPNTDDMRDSPSLAIIEALQKAGASLRAYDPQGMDEAATLLEDVTFCEGTYETMEGADALVIVTEWNAFRALDLNRVKTLLTHPVLVDLRNIYNPREMELAGFMYYSVGRGPAGPGA